jgi:wyosine [tRNA(Phe)-imidazoG37] synthetase (radical SAM superfamily)
MSRSNMPFHNSVHDFGSKLADHLGYELIMERSDSMAILLAKNSNVIRVVKQP